VRVTNVNKTSIVRFRVRLGLQRVVSLALGSLLGIASVAVCAETLQAFVSVLPLKHFVERVGGKHVRVAVMVAPGQSPHTFEPSPKQMVELAAAEVYFAIGVPFEDVWMERIGADHPALRVVDVRKGIALRPLEAEAPAHRHSYPEEEKNHGRAGRGDPHIWTDPRRVEIIADNIRETLVALDPAHHAEYESNYTEFVAELERLDKAIRRLLMPKQARRFMVFHPAWSYFAEAYGLEQISIEIAGKEPGARQLAKLIDTAKAQGIRVIFVQAQFSRRNAETVARAIGGRVIAVDPLAENYTENLLLVAETFAEAMQ
jgi:zinc transport system substrate-binding protein